MLLVDTEMKSLIQDVELKTKVSKSRPYGEWLKKQVIEKLFEANFERCESFVRNFQSIWKIRFSVNNYSDSCRNIKFSWNCFLIFLSELSRFFPHKNRTQKYISQISYVSQSIDGKFLPNPKDFRTTLSLQLSWIFISLLSHPFLRSVISCFGRHKTIRNLFGICSSM